MDDYVIGNVRKIIYRNENGYVVGVFKIKDSSNAYDSLKNESISFTGYFHEIDIDESYKFRGSIVNHPKYGEQFNVFRIP